MTTPHRFAPGSGPSLFGRLLVAMLVLTVSVAAKSADFSTMVVFGTSLSDTGRLYDLTDGAFPMRRAYWNGRQSNGPVWVEYLANRLILQAKPQYYAVVGALTAPTPERPEGNVWADTYEGLEGTDLAGQLQAYLADRGGWADPNALYIIEGGGNDLIGPLLALMANPPSPEVFLQTVQALATTTVTNLVTMTATLRMRGAQHIMVMNLPDFSHTPRFVRLGPTVQQLVAFVVQTVNGALEGALDSLDAAFGATTVRLDAAALINAVVSDPASFGFSNVNTDFITRDPDRDRALFAAPRGEAWYWFFWDDIHPTTDGHQTLAEFAFLTLQETWPLPVVNRGRH